MSRKNTLNSVRVPIPCDEDWNNMIGDSLKRFCLGCEKDVYNLSAMSRKEASKFVSGNAGKFCIRYARLPDGTVLTADRTIHQISRKTSVVAAGIIAASVSLSGLSYAQNNKSPLQKAVGKVNQTQGKRHSKTSQISFTILDPRGDVIPEVGITLTDQKTAKAITILTDGSGDANFSLLPYGRYKVEVSSKYFRHHTSYVQLKEPLEPNLKITLEIAVFTGIFILDWEEIPLFEAIIQHDNDVVKRLIIQGFNVNTSGINHKTALHVAVAHGNLDMVRFLLDHGAKVNAKTKDKRTPILMIEGDDKKNGMEILRLLVSHGADVNAQDKEEKTLLMGACDDENIEAVKILLEAHANPNLKDEDGEAAFQKTNSDEIKKLLIKYGAHHN